MGSDFPWHDQEPKPYKQAVNKYSKLNSSEEAKKVLSYYFFVAVVLVHYSD